MHWNIDERGPSGMVKDEEKMVEVTRMYMLKVELQKN